MLEYFNKKRILHIIKKDKISNMYIKFINEYFDKDEHLFVFIGEYEDYLYHDVNVRFIKNPVTLEKLFFKSKKVFFHGLFDPRAFLLLFLNPAFLKKSYWVVWGGDFHHYQLPKTTFRQIGYEFVRSVVIKNIGNIVTLVPDDFKLIKNVYKTKAKYHRGFYPISVTIKELDRIRDEFIANEKIKILISNSGAETNNHINTFELLKRFKDENIEVYAVLSYGGNKNYVENVIRVGYDIFGDKFKPIRDYMPIDDYYIFLNKMSIFISNHKRQQALGNLYIMFYLGKKVYLRSDTSMFNFFKNDMSLNINDTKKLNNISFDKFKINDKKERLVNIQNSKKLFSTEYIKNIWVKNFEFK